MIDQDIKPLTDVARHASLLAQAEELALADGAPILTVLEKLGKFTPYRHWITSAPL